jgi:predicted MFS family arabinose efflux permease
MRVIPGTDHRAGGVRQRVDLPGAITVTLGLAALVYGVSRASTNGWGDNLTIIALVAALVLLLVFVQIERVLQSPLLPLEIFRRPGLAQANAAMFLLQGSYVGWQFMATLYLQNVRHWSPVLVGLVFAPSGVMIVLTAQRWAGRVMKSGAWPLATIGIVLETLGYLWSLEFGHINVVLVFAGATLIMGIGYAMAYPATNITAVASARTDEQGLASGLFIAAFQIGSGVILGVVASVFISVSHTANAGLSPYRAGILASIGVSVLGILICVAQLIRQRGSAGGGAQQAAVAEPVAQGAEPLGGEASS